MFQCSFWLYRELFEGQPQYCLRVQKESFSQQKAKGLRAINGSSRRSSSCQFLYCSAVLQFLVYIHTQWQLSGNHKVTELELLRVIKQVRTVPSKSTSLWPRGDMARTPRQH